MFINYSWPGNLRECRNVIRRSVLLCSEDKISVSLLPAEIIEQFENREFKSVIPIADYASIDQTARKDIYLKDTAAKAEYEAIMQVLKEVNFNKTKAAIILNVDRKTLYNKIRNYES